MKEFLVLLKYIGSPSDAEATKSDSWLANVGKNDTVLACKGLPQQNKRIFLLNWISSRSILPYNNKTMIGPHNILTKKSWREITPLFKLRLP